MGKCEFCGEDAGFLRSRHRECDDRHQAGVAQIQGLASTALLATLNIDEYAAQAETVAANSYIGQDALRSLHIGAWENAVAGALEDSVLTEQEEERLDAFKDFFSFDQHDLNANGAFTNLVKGGIIREVLEGELPQRVNVSGDIPFNLQKSEDLVWVDQDTGYFEERSQTSYTGGYSGASVRVAKGLYYRVGGFRGRPVVTSQMTHVDDGILGVTQKHIYFAGSTNAFRVRYDKIVAFTPYSDGIGLQRDAARARPQVFVTGDGWFIYNLVTNLAKLAAT